MKTRIQLYLVLGALAFVCGPAQAQSPQELFKEALFQETTVRNPEAAAALHERVATNASADRQLRAQAYVRLGICQKVLGNHRDAAKAWETVIAEYSDQKEEHREAMMHRQAFEMEERPVERVVVHELQSTHVEWE